MFSHLALRFATHSENLATEALQFVLQKSPSAAQAFIDFVRLTGADVPSPLRYATQQVGADASIPDMKCRDEQGCLRVIVENKFWAGLTDNQPVTYIRELSDVPGIVLFIVPEARMSIVWHELLSVCRQSGVHVTDVNTENHFTVGVVGGRHRLAVSSWRNLLRLLSTATMASGDLTSHNDIGQLQGLCERMDAEAFLPLRSDELTNLEMARRVVNFSDLPFDIVNEAVSLGYCDRKRLRETSSRYGSGTYIRLGGYEPWFGFDASAWRQLGASPLWVHFAPAYFPVAEIRHKLLRLFTSNPQRCFDFAGQISVPVLVPAGVEKRGVVLHAARQLAELAAELQRAQTAGAGA